MTPDTRKRRRWPYAVGAAALALALTATPAVGAVDDLLTSPDGSTFSLTVDNDGKLGTKRESGPTPVPTTAPPTSTAPPTTTPPAGTTSTVDDRDPAFAYSAGWTACGGCGGTAPLNGSYRYANDAGSSYTLTFTGTSVALFGMKERPGGTATVTIDGKAAGTINHYAATQSGPVEVFRADDLAAGAHKVVVTATGQKGDPAALGSAVTIDRAVVNGSATTAPPTSTAPTTTPPVTSAPPTSTPPTSNPPVTPGKIQALRTSGNKITYAGGGEAWLLGYNSFTMGGACGTAAEVAAANAQAKPFIDSMRQDGHGVLRLFYWSGYSAGTKAALQDLVNYAGARNIYTVLTLSDGQKGCGNAGPDTLAANGYAHVKEAATRFKGNPAVAFFEVANEPNNEAWTRGYLDKARTTVSTIKGIDSTRLVGSGHQASYFLGGGDAESKRRQAEVNKVVDITSMHDYEGGCDASRTREELSLSQGKPMVMGEFGTLDSGSFNSRSGTFACKLKTWAGYDGFAGAFGWAWQPGNGGSASEYGNLDADTKTQQVLKTASL